MPISPQEGHCHGCAKRPEQKRLKDESMSPSPSLCFAKHPSLTHFLAGTSNLESMPRFTSTARLCTSTFQSKQMNTYGCVFTGGVFARTCVVPLFKRRSPSLSLFEERAVDNKTQLESQCGFQCLWITTGTFQDWMYITSRDSSS